LIQQIGGKPAPACGFAMGVERILALIEDRNEPAVDVAPDVYLVHQGEAADRLAERLAEQLRDHALTVVLHCGGGSFKSQMKRADASRARYAVIVGDDEARAGMVSVKALRELTAQAQVSLEEAVDLIRKDKRR
jgi:histidyl-tRNA synthetase